jgi:hypothetical protein
MARAEDLFGTDARIREKIEEEIEDKAIQGVLYLILDRMQTMAERLAVD